MDFDHAFHPIGSNTRIHAQEKKIEVLCSLFRMTVDDELFMKYWKNKYMRTGHKGACTRACKMHELCSMACFHLPMYLKCTNTYAPQYKNVSHTNSLVPW